MFARVIARRAARGVATTAGLAAAATAVSGVGHREAACEPGDNIEIPKSTLAAALAVIGGATGLYIYSKLPSSDERAKDYSKVAVISMKLKESLDATKAILGEPSLALKDTAKAAAVLVEKWSSMCKKTMFF